MMANYCITIGVKWVRAEGSGGECMCCGEACWLAEYRLVLDIAGTIRDAGHRLCAACWEDA
jgi:hypothetical protein